MPKKIHLELPARTYAALTRLIPGLRDEHPHGLLIKRHTDVAALAIQEKVDEWLNTIPVQKDFAADPPSAMNESL